MNQKIKSTEDLLQKVEKLKKTSGADLSTAEDLSIAVMNLISLEEHFFFTAVKTKKDDYFNTAGEIREIRKELLAKLMPENEGESWCIAKHLLSGAMRLIEVGNKLQTEGKKEESKDMFKKAYSIYTIFWVLKLKFVNGDKVKEVAGASSTLEDLVSKLAHCCDE